MELLSVVIPCFNHEKYVMSCINAIPSSYSGRIKIILCDDSSTDESFAIAKKCLSSISNESNGRISFLLLRNEKNSGICKTINRCLEHIDGEFVYLTASDDFLLPGSLDVAVKDIKNKKVDLLISDCKVVNEGGEIISNSGLFEYKRGIKVGFKKAYELGLIKSELVMNWVLPGPVSLFRADIYHKIGFYDENLMVEDRDFYLRIFSKLKVGFSSEKISCYRVHGNGTSRSPKFKEKIKEEMRAVNLKHARHFGFPLNVYLYMYYPFNRGFVLEYFSKICRFFIYSSYRAYVKLRFK